MKPPKPLGAACAALLFCFLASLSFAQNPDDSFVEVDPAEAWEEFISLGEFNTDGDAEGWVTGDFDGGTVSDGAWSGFTIGGDPIFEKTLDEPIDVSATPRAVLEFRMKRSAGDMSNIQVFWGDAGGGFAEPVRRSTILAERIPDDGEFHTYRLPLAGRIAGELRALRIDPTISDGIEVAFDYVRFTATGIDTTTVLEIDPENLVNYYVSLAEFNTEDDAEGWVFTEHIANPTIAGGVLSATAGGGDPILFKSGLDLQTVSGDYDILEIRMKREETDNTRMDIFIQDGLGGFSEATKFTLGGGQVPSDGEFHVIQIDASQRWVGLLQTLRLDPTSDVLGLSFEIDYIRLGIVAPDGDGDGLPDRVETNTGVFIDAHDTGTKPDVADTDGDGFNDGDEVRYETDPNDSNSKPNARLSGYTFLAPVYVIDQPITANNPVVDNGTPTGFTISPALPPGLSLAPATGVITGTPTALAAAATYTVTVSFTAAPASSFEIQLAVVNPQLTGYTLEEVTYKTGQEITPNKPRLLGPPPANFTITPELPPGLFLDDLTGDIYGLPEEISPLTSYTVTGEYQNYPDSTAFLSIRVLATPVLVIDPDEPLTEYETLGEFDFDNDPEGWSSFNISPSIIDGIATITATAPDPQVFKTGLGYDMTDDAYSVLEFRLRRTDFTQRLQIFWHDDTGNFAESRSFVIPFSDFLEPAEDFHVYQIHWFGALEGSLYSLRIDDGDNPGWVSEFDYIRLGRAGTGGGGTTRPLVITQFGYQSASHEASLTWTSESGRRYTVDYSDSLRTGQWNPLQTDIVATGATTTFLDTTIPAQTPVRFYRVREQAP